MNVQTQQCGAVRVVRPNGPLVTEAAADLKQQLTDQVRQHQGRVVLDAQGIPYLDSQGLEALVDVAEELSFSGQSLKVCGPNPTVREVFDLTGVTDRFEFYEDAHAAVRSFL